MSFLITYFLVILSVALGDVCWTLYFLATAEHKAIKAGFWSAMIMLAGSFSVVSYIGDHRMISAAMIGAFLGTYLVLKFKKKEE